MTIEEMREKLSYYEDLEQQGRIVVLPRSDMVRIATEVVRSEQDTKYLFTAWTDCSWCEVRECDTKEEAEITRRGWLKKRGGKYEIN